MFWGIPIHSSIVITTMMAGIHRIPNASLHARSVARYLRNGASAGPSRSPLPGGASLSSPPPHPA